MDPDGKSLPPLFFRERWIWKKEGPVRGGDYLKESGETSGKASSSERVKIISYNNVF